MSFHFRPANTIHERFGLFVSLVGGTNSGKTVSGMRLARGIAGPSGKIAVLDTEGGRTLHLKEHFTFDAHVMEAPFRPERFADAAKAAEDAGYDVLLIDSFSAEWAGEGGVLSWHDEEMQRLVASARDKARAKGWQFDEQRAMNANKLAAWIEPKSAHKAMVYSLLQRRIPIIFSIRGEASIDAETKKEAFRAICDKRFPFEVTVSFRLAADRKGFIDLSDPAGWKMEGSHREIFRDGDQLSERHGEALRAWAAGGAGGQQAAAPAATAPSEAQPAATAPTAAGIPLQTSTGTAMYERGGQWLDAIQEELKTAAKSRAATAAWQANVATFERLAERAPAAMAGAFDAVRQLAAELMDEERV